MNMGLLFVFTSVILSIIKANHWCYIPTFCISLCWVIAIAYLFVYVFSRSFAKNVVKELERQKKLQSDEEVKSKIEEAQKVYEAVE